jgi:hypothetical protein
MLKQNFFQLMQRRLNKTLNKEITDLMGNAMLAEEI